MKTHTTTTRAKLSSKSTHLIIHQVGAGEPYKLWTQHQSERNGLKTMRALGRNCAQGHFRLMERDDALKILDARYYAIIAKDGSGPAMGTGTSESQAWDDSTEWGLSDREGHKCVEITPESRARILGGDPDAVAIVEQPQHLSKP